MLYSVNSTMCFPIRSQQSSRQSSCFNSVHTSSFVLPKPTHEFSSQPLNSLKLQKPFQARLVMDVNSVGVHSDHLPTLLERTLGSENWDVLRGAQCRQPAKDQ